jgi:lactate dehydrogenase-like 2-hydroxyacid dehydrogenase
VAPFLLLVTKVNIASPLLVELNNLTLLLPGAGYDQVDVHACTDRGIKVSNVPTAVDDATADVNMFLILGALRGFNTSMIALREGKWRGNPPPPLGHDPEGKTLGILGMGGIGRNLKKKAEAFGMKVVYHNRNKLSEELAGGADYVNFETLLSDSDVISLNLPLNVSFLVTALWMGMQLSTRLRWFAEYRMTCIMLS